MSWDEREHAAVTAARRQHGLLSRGEALELGYSSSGISRRVKQGRWEVILPGVYVLEAAADAFRQRLMAVVLWSNRSLIVSHRSAACLHGLPLEEPTVFEFSGTRRVHAPSVPAKFHLTNALPPCDISELGTLPLTSVARTLLDLGSVVETERVEIILDDALRRGMVSLPRLRWRLEELGTHGRRGCGVLRELVAAREGSVPLESALEKRFVALLKRHRLPLPVSQFEVRDGGKVVARVDFAYPTHRVIVEVDGHAFHGSRLSWQRDLARQNQLVSRGWTVIRFTWEDITRRPQDVAAQVRHLVGQGTLISSRR